MSLSILIIEFNGQMKYTVKLRMLVKPKNFITFTVNSKERKSALLQNVLKLFLWFSILIDVLLQTPPNKVQSSPEVILRYLINWRS